MFLLSRQDFNKNQQIENNCLKLYNIYIYIYIYIIMLHLEMEHNFLAVVYKIILRINERRNNDEK